MKTDHQIPSLAELEELESTGVIRHLGLGTLRAELARQRAEHDRDERLTAELGTARTLLREHQRQAAVERVLLPSTGTEADALIVSLRGTELARETVDGRLVAYSLGGVIGFVKGATWPRIAPQVREALVAAHRPAADEPSGFVLVEPGGKQSDLLALLPATAHPKAMAREALAIALARALPLTPLTVQWFRAALDSLDEAAGPFCSILRNRFAAHGRAGELELQRPRFSAAE